MSVLHRQERHDHFPWPHGLGDRAEDRERGSRDLTMRVLLVIVGMLAGLSAAQAAEKDDLVSVFQAVCMTSGSFSDSARDFATAHGWEMWTRPNGEVHTVFSRKQVRTGYQPPLHHFSALQISVSEPEKPDRAQFVHQNAESCSVREHGFKKRLVKSRLLAVSRFTQPSPPESRNDAHIGTTSKPLGRGQPISNEVRTYFGIDALTQTGQQWTLSSEPWDYVVFSETRHRGESTSLFRIRTPMKEKP